MARYLHYGNPFGDGLKGLLGERGLHRVAAAKELFRSMGEMVESYSLGSSEYDNFISANVPDNAGAASASLHRFNE